MLLELDPSIAWSPDLLDTVYVRAASGMLVPIGAFAEVRRSVGELSINQLGQLPAVTISFNLPPGVSLGEAVARAEALRTQLGLPETITSTFSGTAQEFHVVVAFVARNIGPLRKCDRACEQKPAPVPVIPDAHRNPGEPGD